MSAMNENFNTGGTGAALFAGQQINQEYFDNSNYSIPGRCACQSYFQKFFTVLMSSIYTQVYEDNHMILTRNTPQ